MRAPLPETGAGPLAVVAAWAAYEGASALVRIIADAVFATEPEPDAAPLPFAAVPAAWGASNDGCAIIQRTGPVAGVSTPLRVNLRHPQPVGALGGVSAEYAEAFERLETLVRLARDCATDKLSEVELRELRNAVAAAMNAGIELTTDAAGDQWAVCTGSERPTRGQVRAWLGALATQLGKLCADSELAAFESSAAQPLTVPAPRVTGLSPLGWLAVAAAVGGLGWLLWRAAA